MTMNARRDERPRSGQPDGRPERPAVPFAAEEVSHAIGDWLRFDGDGTVTIMVGKAEVGQGLRTSLALAVAEELRILPSRVRVLFADTHVTPYDMGTFGSRTTPYTAPILHKAAAAAREVFVDRAAEKWQVDRAELEIAEGCVVHPHTDRSVAYADLMHDSEAGKLSASWGDDAPVTPPDRWTVAGTRNLKGGRHGRDFVTGRHRYTTDLVRPGMMFGAVLRPPSRNATLRSLDRSASEDLPGVTVVRTPDLAGVVAPSRAAARRALAALRPEWDEHDVQEVSSQDLFDYLKTHPAEPPEPGRRGGPEVFAEGSIQAGLAAGRAHTLEAAYRVPYIAHAPLETRAAIAEWSDDKGELTVWTGTQRPFGVRSELATIFGIPEERVRVIVPDTGSAYGGKHTGDAGIEAARLSLAAGCPIKLAWSREEEFNWAYFRPAGLIEVRSAVDAGGRITAWEYHNYNSGAAGIRTPYRIENQHIEFHPTESPLRQGSYRALAATANHFARESHMDELAHTAGIDPLEFRMLNLPDRSDPVQSRLRAVLLAAAEAFGWPRQRRSGRGYGLACGTEKGSYLATCAEVEVDQESGQVEVVRVVQAYECGAIVDPDGLENQVEGAMVMGLGGALMEQIEFSKGTLHTDRFSRYRVPRFRDMPAIQTILIDRKDLPSTGAGETPIIGIAPAVANAIYSATQVRLRDLPLALPRTGGS